MQHPDVLIIGGGVIGLTTAYFLAREGVRVAVLDQGAFGQEASWAGAGILPPSDLATAKSPFDQLRAHSVALLPTLSAELRERTGIDNGYWCCGGLEFASTDAHAAEEWRGAGIASARLSTAELARLQPGLASADDVYHLPAMAQLRNPRHMQALRAACVAFGVELTPSCAVTTIVCAGQRVTAVATTAGPCSAGQYLLASGAWTEPLLAQLGWHPGIQPIRGQIALLQCATPWLRTIVVQGARYVVPRQDGRVLIGSTEEAVGFDRRTTAEAIAELLQFALRLAPGLRDAPLERCWAGLRPGSADGLPILGAVPGCENLFVAAGHFRAGIQLSAGTALVMRELLLRQPATLDLRPFRLERFARV